jgi:hypothetical protein
MTFIIKIRDKVLLLPKAPLLDTGCIMFVIFSFGNLATPNLPTPPFQHRTLGLILKLIKLHFLTYPTQTTGSALKDNLLACLYLVLLVKSKHPLYSNILFEHLEDLHPLYFTIIQTVVLFKVITRKWL